MTRWTGLTALICVFVLATAVQAQQAVQGSAGRPATTAPASEPAKETPPNDPAVAILLAEKPIHDFGHVWVGDLLHTFTIKNVGGGELQITAVKPSCGCTTAGQYPRNIPPGGSGEIPFRLSSERYEGQFSTTITVESNDPAHAQTKLTLSGYVKHYVKLSARGVQFGRVEPDAQRSQTITLTNNTESPMKPTIVEAQPSQTFKAQLAEVEAGRKYELKVTIAPPYQPRYNQHMLKIDTGIPNAPPLTINCSALVPDRLALSPEVVFVAPGRTVSPREVTFTNNGNTPVKLLSASSLDKSLEITVAERTAGKEYVVSVAMPENYLPPPEGSEIVLKTDDQTQPELRVPVRGLQTAAADPTQRPQMPPTPPTPPTPSTPPTPPTPRPKPAMGLLGKPAPKVAAKTHDQKDITVGGASDKVQLLTFYASWCGYCRKAMPYVDKIREQYKDKGVDVVAVNIDVRTGRMGRTEQQTLDAYKQWKVSLPMVMDPEQSITRQFNMQGTGVPAFFLVGKDGTIQAVHTGYVVATDNTLTGEIDVLLQGKTRADFPPPPAKPTTPRPAAGG